MPLIERNNFLIQRMQAEASMNACMNELIEAGFSPIHDSFTVVPEREEEFKKIIEKHFPRVDVHP